MRKGPKSHPPEREFLFAHHLKELRKQKFPNRGGPGDCAKDIPTDKYQYYNWENGTRTPNVHNMKKLADYFGVDLAYFEAVPEGWNEIHQKMIAKWRERAKRKAERKGIPIDDSNDAGESKAGEMVANKSLPKSLAGKEAQEDTGLTEREALGSMIQMNTIMKVLWNKQKMVDEGKLDAKKFAKALEELQSYMMFKLRD